MDKETIDKLLSIAITYIGEDNRENNVTLDYVNNVLDKIQVLSKTLFDRELSEEDTKKLAFEIKNHFHVSLSDEAIILGDNKVQRWFDDKKTEIKWDYWEAYKKSLLNQRRPKKVIDENERVIDSILDFSGDPNCNENSWSRKGLVMGNVQSGKTQNYIGLINKAFDSGYKIVILLGGHMNDLRKQTQIRVDADVIGLESKHLILNKTRRKIGVGIFRNDSLDVATLTSTENDFSKKVAQTVSTSLTSFNCPLIITIKKNTSILQSLIDYIKESSALNENQKLSVPMILIDDEADYASVNGLADRNRISRTNELIRTLLNLFHKNHYVAYTATPFANVFIDPNEEDEMLNDDLFPKNYMVRVPVPENYCGQEFFFGDDSLESDKPSTIIIDDNETEMLPLKHNKNTEITQISRSLKDAIMSFVIATSARMLRPEQDKHNTMMINITHLKDLQNDLKKLVEEFKDKLTFAIYANHALPIDKALKNPEISELKRVYEENFDIKETFEEILKTSNKAANKIKVYAINNKSGEVLDYSDYKENGLCAIAIGGYKLSRGLTLEGLTISYFARNSKMYDTLMQMCRWFGYRPGYKDLCKVFLPKESRDWYKFISSAINDLYAQLQRMKDQEKTPSDFGLQIRTHPGALMVTARNKRGTGEERLLKLDLWAKRIRRFIFEDDAKNNQNFELIDKFLKSLEFSSERDKEDFIFKDVKHEKVVELIEQLDLLPDHIPNDVLIDFIKNNMEKNNVSNFRVTVMHVKKNTNTAWMEKTQFNDSCEVGGYPFKVPRRKMESDGVKISNPKSELGNNDDEKLLFNKNDREEIKNSLNFKPDKNDSYVFTEKRNFPGLIIYLFNVRILTPFESKLWGDNLSNLEVTQPFTKPAVGISISFPQYEFGINGLQDSDQIKAYEESTKIYTQNHQRQLEMQFDLNASTYDDDIHDD